MPGVARAADWTIDLGFTLTEEFTDNVALVADNVARDNDFVTELGPTLAIRGVGARASADLDYALRQQISANTSSRERVHDLNARSQIELLEQFAFLGATATVGRERLSTGGAVTPSIAGQRVNTVNTQAFQINPSFVHRFGRWVESQALLSFGAVNVENAATSDTKNYSATGSLNSGDRFGRMRWELNGAYARLTRTRGLGAAETKNGSVGLGYAIDRNLQALATVGYERIQDGTLTDEPAGIFWNVGFQYQSGPDTEFQLSVGRRYEGTSVNAAATHDITSRSTIRLSVSDALTTSQRDILDDAAFIGVAPDLSLIDTRTGLPFDAGAADLGLQSATSRLREVDLTFTTETERNTFAAGVRFSSRDTDATSTNEIVYGANLAASRRLSRRLTGAAAIDYSNIDFDLATGRVDDTIVASATFTYQIFRDGRAEIGYARTHRRSNIAANDLTENSAFVRLGYSF